MNNSANTVNQDKFKIDPLTKIGYVSLNISDIQRSLEFYQSILGFRLLGKPSNNRALLTNDANSSHLVELLEVRHSESSSRITRRAGLYHFAILLPERKYLADMLLNLREKKNKVHFDGLADHLVSESIYIRDPDFNGIEIYRDRPASEWNWNGSQIEMATLRLDTDDLLKESTEQGWKELPARTMIGHVHLHVQNLAKAIKFYHEIMGLNLTTMFPGAAFFAVGEYHHHIAANTWLGTDIPPASPQGIGLNHFGVEVPSKEEYARLVKQLSRHGVALSDSSDGSVFVRDMDGIQFRVQYRQLSW
jgi:catechol 2,3-dioxygenase